MDCDWTRSAVVTCTVYQYGNIRTKDNNSIFGSKVATGSDLRASALQKFPGGACHQTPLAVACLCTLCYDLTTFKCFRHRCNLVNHKVGLNRKH